MAKIKGDDVVSILEFFRELEDPRCSINQKHLLGDLIVIRICGVIAGADGPQAIGVWANANARWLRRYFEPPNGIPSHDTIGRLLATLKPAAFRKATSLSFMPQSLPNRDGEATVGIAPPWLRCFVLQPAHGSTAADCDSDFSGISNPPPQRGRRGPHSPSGGARHRRPLRWQRSTSG